MLILVLFVKGKFKSSILNHGKILIAFDREYSLGRIHGIVAKQKNLSDKEIIFK